ncbi:MAG: hypothetical protein EXS13_08830 [Planctomycetes bacterium]|nr:hypothetical protein [Planctomycetota bacterium]
MVDAIDRDAEIAEYQEQVAAEREAARKVLPEFERAWREQDFAKVADLANGLDQAFDPDAKQAWTRLMEKNGRFANGAPTKADLEARLFGLEHSDDQAAHAAAWLAWGDCWTEEGCHQQSALCYRSGTAYARKGSRPAVVTSGLLRQARALLAAGHFEVVARKLQQISGRAVPPALEFEAQIAAVKEAVAADRAARVAKELGDFIFPADVVFPGALARAKGVTIERDGAMAKIRRADGALATVRVDVARPLGSRDPWPCCMVLEGVASAPDVALLFANGDLFIGADSLIGSGLYLSAERPATVGPCRFGIPLERATGAIDETVHAELSDGEVSVAAKYADDSGYVGTAVRDGGRLIPHGYGLMFRPEEGG